MLQNYIPQCRDRNEKMPQTTLLLKDLLQVLSVLWNHFFYIVEAACARNF